MSNEINNVIDRLVENLDEGDIRVLMEHYKTDILQSSKNKLEEYHIFWNDLINRLDEIKLQLLKDLRDRSIRCSFCAAPSNNVGSLCQINNGQKMCLLCAQAVVDKLTGGNH